MITKVLVKEMDGLKQTLINLREDLVDTVQKTASVNASYIKAKEKNDKKMIALGNIVSKQEKKLDDYSKMEKELEIKINALDLVISEWQTGSREETDELQKMKNENAEEQNTTIKTMKSLNYDIEKTRLEVECDEEYLIHMERDFEASKAARAREFSDKLEKIRRVYADRMKAAEDKYIAKRDPLLFRIKCLDEDIDELENQIMAKPKEEAALTRRHNELQKKLAKAVMARLAEELEMTIEAIHKTLDFFRQEPRAGSTDDITFGVLLAKSNFHWIINRIRSRFGRDHVVTEKLAALMEKSKEILELNNNETENGAPLSFLSRKFWKGGAEDIREKSLQVLDFDYPRIRFRTCENVRDYLMRGSPFDSDKCIKELFQYDCNVSNECWLSEMNNQSHSGYKTSHRLIYLQAASKLNCENKNGEKFSRLKEKKGNLCGQMLSEARYLERYTDILAVQDLFLEQIALCGFEGFGEFGDANWRKKVRKFQNSQGCFGDGMISVSCSHFPVNDIPGAVKRTDTLMRDCHSHVTAAALSAMSFHLRFILNSALLHGGSGTGEYPQKN